MAEAVAGGAGFDDGAVEGEPVDDRGAEPRIGKGPASEPSWLPASVTLPLRTVPLNAPTMFDLARRQRLLARTVNSSPHGSWHASKAFIPAERRLADLHPVVERGDA